MSEPVRRLYGKVVEVPSRMTLAEQIYCILCEEIQAGRWEIGERLPGVAMLSDMSGVSRAPIQQAFSRLEAEGWVKARARSGTYLQAVLPYGREALGAIGIAMRQEALERDDPTQSLHLHAILEGAVQKNYVTEVVTLGRNADWAQLNCRGVFFSNRVRGIISLHAFPYIEPNELPVDRLPLLFWGQPPGPLQSLPMVVHDTALGFYLLTRHVLSFSHRRILFCAMSDLDESLVSERRKGCTQALQEAGLAFDQSAFDECRQIDRDDAWRMGEFLDAHIAEATAIICFSTGLAQGIAQWAEHRGYSIPGDLSIAGHTAEPLHAAGQHRQLAGIDYRLNDTVDILFRILAGQTSAQRCTESLVRVKPVVRPGNSLTMPRADVSSGTQKISGVTKS